VPAAILAAGALAAVSVLYSRDVAIQRLVEMSLNDEIRFQYMPTLRKIAADFFPVGVGFGTFDPVFRSYEPTDLLQANYFNHAHNDLFELVIEGGLAPLLVLAFFLVWLGRRASVFVKPIGQGRGIGFRRLGVAIVVMVLLASLADYPLRTPLIAMLFAVACAWAGAEASVGRSTSRTTAGRKVLYP
jgi:O-antigen ligase